MPRLFGTFPDWRDQWLAIGEQIGSVVATLIWGAWAAAVGALEHVPALPPPLAARARLADAIMWGTLFGTSVAATLPPWLLWWLTRLRVPMVTPPRDAVPDRPALDPALLVAAGWSLALVVPFLAMVAWEVSHPVPSWLLLPPLEDGARAPLAEWCPYALYARHRECEVYLGDALAQGAHSIDGYAYAGARCVPEANLRLPSPRECALAVVEAGLRRAFEETAVVERDGRVGDGEVDFVVRRRAGDEGAALVAVDVLAETNRLRNSERASRLATAGISAYWQVTVDPSREIVEMLTAYRDPDLTQRRFQRLTSTSRNSDMSLRLDSLPDLRVPVASLFASSCPPRPGSRVNEKMQDEGAP